MDRGCEHCLWADQCYREYICEHFTPLEDELNDNAIEENRFSFREEWYELLEELEEVEALWQNS